MIAPGRNLKCPDFFTQAFTNTPYTIEDAYITNTMDGPVDQDIGNVPSYTTPFVVEQNSGYPNKLYQRTPFVGNPLAGAVYGMSETNCLELETATRELHEGETVTIIEPENYFGKPGTLLKVPRTVLIRLAGGSGDVPALFKPGGTYENIIEQYAVQLIFEGVTDANTWAPFSYGCPHDGWTAPGSKTPFTGFEGGEFLCIYFTGNGYGPIVSATFGPVYPPGDNTGQQIIVTPYFASTSPASIDYLIEGYDADPPPAPAPPPTVPGFGHTDIAGTYTLIAGANDPGDGLYWLSLEERYYRRSWVMHNTGTTEFVTNISVVGSGTVVWDLDGGDPADWTIVEDNRILTVSTTMGSTPYGAPDSATYFNTYAAVGQTLGRTVSESAEDIALAIIEDIEAFFTPLF